MWHTEKEAMTSLGIDEKTFIETMTFLDFQSRTLAGLPGKFISHSEYLEIQQHIMETMKNAEE